jgi:Tfp pilus assembly protein FimT
LEALFVVAILGILLALAFPSYQRVVMERRVQNTTREIAGLLRAAQQAAVAKSAEAKCVGVAFEATQEATRVRVYVVPQDARFDCSNPTASGLSAHEVLLTSQDYPVGVTVSPSGGDAIAFLPSGERRPENPAVMQVSVSGGGQERYVCVNQAGLVTVPPAGQDCSTQ